MRYISHSDIIHTQKNTINLPGISILHINDKKRYDKYVGILDQYDDEFVKEHDLLEIEEVRPYLSLGDTQTKETNSERYNRIMKGSNKYHVILENRVPVGSIIMHLIREVNTIAISSIYVAPEYRGKSIGKYAIETMKSKYKQKKYVTCLLSVLSTNKAFDLYKSLGFKTWNYDMYCRL
ncbi:MAG: GNAT family N-acetyltransferase [Alphaproteobacteria bacterium]|nr:GNAT family N-acetyltransferase [Alphaproteobacteria bacterium]